MQYLGLLFTVFGLLALGVATPNGGREKRQYDVAVQNCQEIFNAPCDTLNKFPSTSTLPPLNTALPKVQVPDCECVFYNLCSSKEVSNSDGSFVIDKRLGETCAGTLDVCCPKSFILQRPVDEVTPTPTFTPGPTPRPMPTPRPTLTPMPTPTPTPTRPVNPVRTGCGYRNPEGSTVRITGSDNEAQFAEFPWMVAVIAKPAPGVEHSGYICGGSLIHPRVVLTAAHTIEGLSAQNLVVRAGDWDSQSRSEPIPHQQLSVQTIIMHEDFNTNNLQNDFALLITEQPFAITPSVNTICLPRENDGFDAVRCTATGWGKDTFEAVGRFQAVLKKIELPVVPHAHCQTNLRRTRLGSNFILNQSFICAGGEAGQDTCTGDGGSPLACPSKNAQDRYVQAGIVAWGIGCGADRTPGVYANVGKARQWIDSKMAQYNLDTSSYQCPKAKERLNQFLPFLEVNDNPLRTSSDMRSIVINFVVLALTGSVTSADVLGPSGSINQTQIKTRADFSSTESCVCVPYYLCNSENIVITNGEGEIDIRQARSWSGEVVSACDDYLEVCCMLHKQPNKPSTCGLRQALDLEQFVPRLDQEEAESGEFPWMVTIFRVKEVHRNNETKEAKVYQCQGTLIHESVVITAAQCVHDTKNTLEPLWIRAGQTDTMMTLEEDPYQEVEVRSTVVHKNYNPQTLLRNVALLFLKTPVTINRRVNIACLANYNDNIDEKNCMVIGWDKFLAPEDVYFQRSQTNMLRKRVEPYVEPAACVTALKKTPLGKSFQLHNSFVCAGGQSARKNFCSREIGAPLACPLKSNPNRYVQLGIGSWCMSSGNFETPSIFASVPQLRRWIDREMRKANFDTSGYKASKL
ncbi:uncharacterized protein LOC124413673 [Diprion similis]|uniref:uncharacterized protein LOC124413673 n=1 Tax=Diprion similis TaxID=362088 RepID=UPI001EF95493|nr:uncharacterized protein LOC124413673 [Diprion similis]